MMRHYVLGCVGLVVLTLGTAFGFVSLWQGVFQWQ